MSTCSETTRRMLAMSHALVLALVGALLAGGSSWAQEQPPAAAEGKADEAAKDGEAVEENEDEKIVDMPEEELKEELDRVIRRVEGPLDRADFPALEAERRKKAVRNLGALPHPLTYKALQKILTGRKNESDVRGTAAETMGFMKFCREDAGKYLVTRIDKEWKDPTVLIGIARGLGILGVVPDRDKMYRYFKHNDDAVYVSMIECLGLTKDVQNLPKLAEIFAQFGRISTAGVSVRVDTGTAGPKDQQSAEARGRGMLKKARADRREGAQYAVTQAIYRITGEKFEFADKFQEWYAENAEKLGVDDPKAKKKRGR